MARHERVAGVYARAVFEHLKTADKATKVSEELKAFSDLLSSSEELKRVLTHQIFSNAQRAAVVADIVAAMKLSDDARKILSVLSGMGRADLIQEILVRLHGLILESGNIVPLVVYSSANLESDEKKKIEEKFAKLFGKDVEATYGTDSRLLGGVKVTAGNRTFDGSLSGMLATFEEKLAEGSM